jgi:predicted metal-dependent enzyme (double-stranded beta helix superfamily)
VFDVDELVRDCIDASAEDEPHRAVREVVARAVVDPGIVDALPPRTGGITLLYRSDTLSVLNIVWTPHVQLFAHDHRMWACIGIFAGVEDNEFFRRRPDDPARIERRRGVRLPTGDVTLLGDDTIHAVSNPADVPTGAIHVYGGDFVAQERSQWRPPALTEEAYDYELVRQTLAEAERAQVAGGPSA